MTTNRELNSLNRDLDYIRYLLRKYEGMDSPETAGFVLSLREREMQLLERIGKLMDGPP